MEQLQKDIIEKGPYIGVRHIQTLLLFFNKIIVFITRFHIQVTLVAMTNAAKSNPDFPEYKWTEKHKSFIFSSYFVGSLIIQLPAVYALRYFGSKTTLLVSTLVSGVLNGLVPLCTPWGGWQIFCALRFLQGLFEAGINPSSQQHFAHWCPPAERNQLGGLIATGVECGLMIAMAMSGLIAGSSLGWPGVFYVTTGICFSWCLLWWIFGASDANTSRYITTAEQAYIVESLKNNINFDKKIKTPIPWRAILTSMPFWSTVLIRVAEVWGIFTIQAEMPAYLNGIFKVHIRENALMSALPNLAAFLMTFVFMFTANFIRKRKLLTLTAMRKLFNSISMWLPAAGLLWLGFLEVEQKLLAYILLTVLVSLFSAEIYGSVLSRIEMAPNHAGTVSNITDFISSLTQVLVPLLVGFIVQDETQRYQWQIAFGVAALIFCLCDVTFLVWGTSEVQPWNAVDFLPSKSDNEAITPKYITNEFDLPAEKLQKPE